MRLPLPFDLTSPLTQLAIGAVIGLCLWTAVPASQKIALKPDATEITGSIASDRAKPGPTKRALPPPVEQGWEPPLWTWAKQQIPILRY